MNYDTDMFVRNITSNETNKKKKFFIMDIKKTVEHRFLSEFIVNISSESQNWQITKKKRKIMFIILVFIVAHFQFSGV